MLNDTKIFLITYTEKHIEKISHGVGNHSLKNYCLPQIPVSQANAEWDSEECGWYLPVDD